ncbi:hypothetical protein LIER_30836 [Lithospermum erythrorhizon]|uniref:DUF547 domain-containing protein n=1 Tax=Lithospermum erythrorhizon TaxID=34254 RepID=A0AAV3RP10_LITER
MKFEELLMMQQSEENQRKRDLQQEVEKLQNDLTGELHLKGVLQCALEEPSSCPSIPRMSSLIPHEIQLLLAEITMVEDQINGLERKIDDLKVNLYLEKQQNNKAWEMVGSKDLKPHLRKGQCKQKRLLQRVDHHIVERDYDKLTISQNLDERRKHRILKERGASIGSSLDMQSMYNSKSNGEDSRWSKNYHSFTPYDIEIDFEKPNKLSEEFIKCLIGIFLRLNQEALSKTKASVRDIDCTDPYGIYPDGDSQIKDVGSYKKFIQVTRNSMDTNRLTEFHPEMGKLRVLIHELGNVDLTYLSYRQKLAFWINIYNASIMQALLQHGLPPTKEKLLDLMKEAAVNIGGVVLNALAIERFILRLSYDSKHKKHTYEKEMILRHAYGVGYPEPSITFALCRGTWSSPALRIYSPDQVVNDLEKAKVEYLEASVGVTIKKNILIPKLMQWHITDFADDMESLVEWIYSQLPQSTSLKRMLMECLNGKIKSPLSKMIEIQPYEFDFRYLLPS